MIEFNLPRQKVRRELLAFAFKKMRERKVSLPRATKKQLLEIALVAREIRKNGIPSYLVLKKLDKNLGHGIFLHPDAKPILKGAVIAPYSGEVFISPEYQGEGSDYTFSLVSGLTLTREEQRLFDPENSYHPRRLYSVDLDAYKKGNFTRFINHSAKPNVEADLLRMPGGRFEMVYFAKKIIRPGEQLLVSYEGEDKSYWGALKIKPFPMTPKTFQIDASLKLISLFN